MRVEDVDAADRRIGTGTFLGTLHSPKVHAEPIVIRSAVGMHSQSVVEKMHTAEFGKPLANLAYRSTAHRETVLAQNEHP